MLHRYRLRATRGDPRCELYQLVNGPGPLDHRRRRRRRLRRCRFSGPARSPPSVKSRPISKRTSFPDRSNDICRDHNREDSEYTFPGRKNAPGPFFPFGRAGEGEGGRRMREGSRDFATSQILSAPASPPIGRIPLIFRLPESPISTRVSASVNVRSRRAEKARSTREKDVRGVKKVDDLGKARNYY